MHEHVFTILTAVIDFDAESKWGSNRLLVQKTNLFQTMEKC